MIPPTQNPAFNRLPEKLVQDVLYSQCDPLLVSREVNYDGYYLDFLTPRFLVEVKKATSDSGQSNQVARVHAPLGQVLFYQAAHEILWGQVLSPVILLYGSDIRKYCTDIFTHARRKAGVHLWVLTSLRDGLILDLDTNQTHQTMELFNALPRAIITNPETLIRREECGCIL